MSQPTTTFLSLGSNLGEKIHNLQSALENLKSGGLAIDAVSSFYATEPVGARDQPEYINLACSGTTSLSPFELLDLCQRIERQTGRTNKGDHSPRLIDIDILYFGLIQVESKRLSIPHPRMLQRRFVLVPLKEIAPRLIDPSNHKSIDQLIFECADNSRVEIIEPGT